MDVSLILLLLYASMDVYYSKCVCYDILFLNHIPYKVYNIVITFIRNINYASIMDEDPLMKWFS